MYRFLFSFKRKNSSTNYYLYLTENNNSKHKATRILYTHIHNVYNKPIPDLH